MEMDKKGANLAWFFAGIIVSFLFIALTGDFLIVKLESIFDWQAVSAIGTMGAVGVSLYFATKNLSREISVENKTKDSNRRLVLFLCRAPISEFLSIMQGIFKQINTDKSGFGFAMPESEKEAINYLIKLLKADNVTQQTVLAINGLKPIFLEHADSIRAVSFELTISQIDKVTSLDEGSANRLLLIIDELRYFKMESDRLEQQISASAPLIMTGLTMGHYIEHFLSIHRTLFEFSNKNFPIK